MEWRKVKNFIILVLLLVNGFLLLIVGARRGEVRRYETAALEQSIQVMENNGIRVDPARLTGVEGLTVRSAERSVAREQALAQTLLGQSVETRNLGGGLYTYQSELGSVSFWSGGELTAVLEKDPRWHTEDPLTMVHHLMEELGVEGTVLDHGAAEGSGSVTVRQTRDGTALYSCQLTFVFSDHGLTALSGQLLTAADSKSEDVPLLDLPTAMLRFLDSILAGGDVCSAILFMEPGYRIDHSFGGTFQLSPCWLISSNTADYYMDAVTGEVTRAN